jgi:hypothetical protein
MPMHGNALSRQWHGRSTVCTLATGTRINITQSPLAAIGDAASAHTVLRVTSVGVINLSSPAVQALAELFGPIPDCCKRRCTSTPSAK